MELDWDRVLWQRMGKFMFYSLRVCSRSVFYCSFRAETRSSTLDSAPVRGEGYEIVS